MTSKNHKTASVAVALSVLLGADLPAVHAETCVTDPAEVSPVEVCIDWDEPEDPTLGFHFDVDFTTDPAQPNVELIEGNLQWRLWALDPADPEGIGSLGDIEAFGAEDYGLRITTPLATPGARDVKSVVLTPSEPGNFSFISSANPVVPSEITGDLLGDLTLVQSTGGSGGSCSLTIGGDVDGDFWADGPVAVIVHGGISSTGSMRVEQITNSFLTIDQDVDGNITVDTQLHASVGNTSSLTIGGDLNANLSIGEMIDRATLSVGGDCSGIITINSGLPGNDGLRATSSITIGGELTATGTIDLTTHWVMGTITVGRAGAGDIVGIGVLQETFGQATITLGTVSTDVFSGNLSIDFVSASGWGLVQIQNLSGDVEMGVLQGTMDVLGDFTSTGTIDIRDLGFHGELKINSAERIGANAAGVINISPAPFNNPFDGSITVFDSTSSTDGDLSGTITVFGTGGISSTGSIDVGGDVTGTIDVTGNLDGSIDVADRLRAGDIIARSDFAGTIDIGSYMSGDIRVLGDMTSAAAIDVVGELASTGRILVSGECDGGITIGEQTAALSQIRMEGFGSNGQIVVNGGEGDFDAEGNIFVGQIALWPPSPPLLDVTFDGSILINAEAAPGTGGGVLRGDVGVFGCHATTDDLDICQCGTAVSNNVTISQDECTNQVGWSCVSGCP